MKKRFYKTTGLLLLGNLCTAFGVAGFLLPGKISIGGSTGLASILSFSFGLDFSVSVFLVNAALFLAGGIFISWKFALTTLTSVVVYPALLWAVQQIPGLDTLTDEPVYLLTGAGLLIGAGTGLVIQQGSSTGGSDTIGVILNRFLPLPVSVLVFLADTVILLIQFIQTSFSGAIASILLTFVITFSINRVLVSGKSQLQLLIITEKETLLRQILLEECQVGVTMLCMETGYEKQPRKGILCVLSRRRLHEVKTWIRKTDAKAFVTITEIQEVRGEGFTYPRSDGSRSLSVFR